MKNIKISNGKVFICNKFIFSTNLSYFLTIIYILTTIYLIEEKTHFIISPIPKLLLLGLLLAILVISSGQCLIKNS